MKKNKRMWEMNEEELDKEYREAGEKAMAGVIIIGVLVIAGIILVALWIRSQGG